MLKPYQNCELFKIIQKTTVAKTVPTHHIFSIFRSYGDSFALLRNMKPV